MALTFLSRFISVVQSRNSVAVVVLMVAVSLAPVTASEVAGDPVKGQAVFTKNNCVVCHADGDNTMDPGHPIKGPAFSQKYKDDLLLESTIRKGFAKEGMPSFAKTAINEREMKDLIAYVRTFSKIAKKSK